VKQGRCRKSGSVYAQAGREIAARQQTLPPDPDRPVMAAVTVAQPARQGAAANWDAPTRHAWPPARTAS